MSHYEERNEISIQEVKVFVAMEKLGSWRTNKEIAAICEIPPQNGLIQDQKVCRDGYL